MTRGGTLYMPIWLAYCVAQLDENHSVKFIDCIANKWTVNDVNKDIFTFHPGIILIETNFSSMGYDIKTAESIKEKNKYSKIIFVGPPMAQFGKQIIESNDFIDYVATYEYDETVCEIADNLDNNLQNIAGIIYKDSNGNIVCTKRRKLLDSNKLDNIPYVSKIYKKYLDLDNYYLSSSISPSLQVFTGRGCPNKCTFCSWPVNLTGTIYRVRSIKNVIDELKWVENNLPNIKEVFFEDDTFTINQNRVKLFCKLYKENKLRINWSCNARATLEYDTLVEMKKSGCRMVISGFESGNDCILKNIKKGINVIQIKQFSKNVKKANLMLHADFIIGLPGENRDTILKTRNLINEIKPDILQILLPQPIPGTEFYQWCKNNGYLLIENLDEYLDNGGYIKSIVSYPDINNNELEDEAKKILKDYYLSPNYILVVINQLMNKNMYFELKRIIKSAKSFYYSKGV